MENYGKKLLTYKKRYELGNKHLARVLNVSIPTVGAWLKGGKVVREDNKRKIDRLLELDFYKDNVTDLTKEVIKDDNEPTYTENTWSVSRVKTWLDSPFDFYCKYVKGINKPSFFQDALDRGSVLHLFLELMALGLDRKKATQFIEKLNDFSTRISESEGSKKSMLLSRWNDYQKIMELEKKFPILDKPFSDKGLSDGFRVVNKYLDEYGSVENNGKILETEKKLEWDMSEYLPNQKFIGYIDCVIEDEDKGIWLVDYKTYSNKPKFDTLRMEIQANVYMWVMKNVYGIEVEGFIYDCINPKEKIVGRGYHFHKFKISYNERIVEMVMENFLTTIEIILNNPDYTMFKESPYGSVYMEELLHGFEEKNYIKVSGIDEEKEKLYFRSRDSL